MFRKNQGITQHRPSEPVSISDTHQRVEHVLTQIVSTIPEQMQNHPMARMLQTFAKESVKDLRHIPAEFIEQLSQNISEAFMWVAKGKMSDLENQDASLPALPDGENSSEMRNV